MDSTDGEFSVVGLLFYLALTVGIIVAMWKTYEKAGKPGWAAIIPVYNLIILMEIVGRPTWWVILFFVPCVNFVIMFMVMIDLAKSFGKEWWFAFLFFILGAGYFILGFGKDEYKGPAAPTKEAA
ncbi:DUF5684 domain-containing protein [Leptospira idonii]|uniref:Signal peptidase I n=1 Tax=Leptospira idonii TaxID=1193500 RepID=A0A4R9LYM0_9LEPT|nr:DUF5684 domain-containing protein [Leptospira idonii]TGN18555.1 signal peptidase I [Leptospira idonii]